MLTKKIATKIIIILLVILAAGWFLIKKTAPKESEIISQKGIHWHAQLIIKIFGQRQEIPALVGLAKGEKPIHTHEADGVIHLEFNGLVKKEDIKLGRFFEIWDKKFSRDCIFDKCSGAAGQLKMLVNGQPNSEFENYPMRDGDKIEITFE